MAGNLVMIMNLVLLAVLAVWHNNASDLYGYTGTVATLTVLIAYGMMNIASLIRFTKTRSASRALVYAGTADRWPCARGLCAVRQYLSGPGLSVQLFPLYRHCLHGGRRLPC